MVTVIRRGSAITNEEGEITGYERGTNPQEVSTNPSRRQVIDVATGKAYNKTSRKVINNKLVVKGKEKAEINKEINKERTRQNLINKEKQDNYNKLIARENAKKLLMSKKENVVSEKSKNPSVASGTVEPSNFLLSQRILSKATELDKKQDVVSSLSAIPVSAGAFAVSLRSAHDNLLTGKFAEAKTNLGVAKEVFFPEISKSSIYQRSGTTSAGFLLQEGTGLILSKTVPSGINWLRNTFGAKTTISKSKGTGEVLELINKNSNKGSFTQTRVLTREIEELKKSEVIIQRIDTISSTSPRTDTPAQLVKYIDTLGDDLVTTSEIFKPNKPPKVNKLTSSPSDDLLKGLEPNKKLDDLANSNLGGSNFKEPKMKKGEIKTVITPEEISKTVSKIRSVNLAGKQVGNVVTVKTYGVRVPNTDTTIRLVKTIEEGATTKRSIVHTRSKQFNIRSYSEGDIRLFPDRRLSQETTFGEGTKQRVTFGEQTVFRLPEFQKSFGGLSNSLKQVHKPLTPSVPASSPVGGTPARLPVTLSAGTDLRTVITPKISFGGIKIFSPSEDVNFNREFDKNTGFSKAYAKDSLFAKSNDFSKENVLQPKKTPLTENINKLRPSVKKDFDNKLKIGSGFLKKSITKPITRTNKIIIPKAPTIKKPIITKVPLTTPKLLPFNKKIINKNNNNNFQAFVKVRGKWLNVGKGLTKKKATSLGKNFVLRRSSASFKVLSGGKPVTKLNLGSMFRASKKDKGVFVEKRKFRINFGQELQEITHSPKRRKRGKKK